jgi:Flp pilus assembly protein TadB
MNPLTVLAVAAIIALTGAFFLGRRPSNRRTRARVGARSESQTQSSSTTSQTGPYLSQWRDPVDDHGTDASQ